MQFSFCFFQLIVAVPGPVYLFRPINIGDNHVNLEWVRPIEERGDILGYDIGYQSGELLLNPIFLIV